MTESEMIVNAIARMSRELERIRTSIERTNTLLEQAIEQLKTIDTQIYNQGDKP